MRKQTTDECPEERESTRIRAFLARVKPLDGCDFGEQEEYWEARSFLEQLALAYDVGTDDYHWDAVQCATVIDFLSRVEPVKGTCFCHDRIEELGVSTTCGFHAILEFAADEIRQLAPKAKARKHAEESRSD
jgi:hypothetical protein